MENPTAEREDASANSFLNAENGVTEIESLCMNCHDNGITRFLYIQIPFFREVILESFSCDHCGYKDNSVKDAGTIQEKGTKFTFKIENTEDLQRQVIRSDSGIFKVEDLNLEMPAAPGQLTNLESILSKIMTDLEHDQGARKAENPAIFEALKIIIVKLDRMLGGNAFPITVSLDDPAGNSFIQPSPTDKGSKYVRTDYLRSREQNNSLGLLAEDESVEIGDNSMDGVNIVDGEVYELRAECPACNQECTVNAKKVTIPHFKDVIIMATVCEHCGYRTSDVKTGGAIPDKGQRITLTIENIEDMSRDILKSETCLLKSAELGLEVQPGTLGGRFTTVEGLLIQVRDQLRGQIFDVGNTGLAGGDSMDENVQLKWNVFFEKLDQAIRAEFKYSITLQDPLANSFVQSAVDHDPQIVKEDYERTEEEIEDLGLNDMKTEGYENDVHT